VSDDRSIRAGLDSEGIETIIPRDNSSSIVCDWICDQPPRCCDTRVQMRDDRVADERASLGCPQTRATMPGRVLVIV